MTAVQCPYCHEWYWQIERPQIPGFRERDDDVCPYCGHVNGSSMEKEFDNRKMS